MRMKSGHPRRALISVPLFLSPARCRVLTVTDCPLEFAPSSHGSQLRLFAVDLLRCVLRDAVASPCELQDRAMATPSENAVDVKDSNFQEWCVEMLVSQLNRGEHDTTRAALSALEEAAEDERCLRALVSFALCCDALTDGWAPTQGAQALSGSCVHTCGFKGYFYRCQSVC